METKLRLRYVKGRFLVSVEADGIRTIVPNGSAMSYDFARLTPEVLTGVTRVIELVDRADAEKALADVRAGFDKTLAEVRADLEAERARAIEMVKRNDHAEGYAAGLAAARTTAQSQEVDKLRRQVASCDTCYSSGVRDGQARAAQDAYQRGSRDAQIKAEAEFVKIREEAQAAVNVECERATKAEEAALAGTYFNPTMARIQGRKEGREEGYQEGKAEAEAAISALITSQKSDILQKDLVIAALRGEKFVEIIMETVPGPKSNFVEAEIDGHSVNIGNWYTRPDKLYGLRIDLARGANDGGSYRRGFDDGERAGKKDLATVQAARDSWIKLAGEYQEDVERLTKRIAEIIADATPSVCPRCTEVTFALLKAWGIKIEGGKVIDGQGMSLSEEDQAALEMGRVLFDRRLGFLRRHRMDEALRDRHQKAFWKIDRLARRALDNPDRTAGLGGYVLGIQPGRGGR